MPAGCAIATLLAGVPALVVNVWNAAAEHRGERLVPWIEQASSALLLGVFLVIVVFIVLLVRRARPALRPRRTRFKVLYYVGTSLLQLVVAFVPPSIALASDPYLLGSSYSSSRDSRDGKQTAYLYKGGLFCGLDLYVAPRGAWVIRHVDHVAPSCSDQSRARLGWFGSTPAVVDDRGRPITSETWDLPMFRH